MSLTSHDTKSMALFCDFENVALGVRESRYQQFDISKVLERLLRKGSIVVKKAYCDWERYREFKAAMHQASFELIEIPHVRMSGKNSADIRMVVDALDLCYTKAHVDTFVIISGDSDFSPLVSKLRENNKTVIGVGVKNSTSDLLIANCDEFIYYDDLVRDQRQAAGRTQRRRPNGVPVPAGRGVQPSARMPAAAPLAARAPHGAQSVHGAQGHLGAVMAADGRAAAAETRGASAENLGAAAEPRMSPASADALAAPTGVAPDTAASAAEATAAAVAESARQASETVVHLPEAAPAEPAAPAAKPAKAAPRRGRRKAADDVADAAAVAQAEADAASAALAQAAASDAASTWVVPAATAASPVAPLEVPAADDAPEAAAPKRTPRRRTSRKTTADVEAVEAAAAAEQVAPPAGTVPAGAAPDAPDAPHMALPTAGVLAADAPALADAA
ncbi:MAG TPA: NYN domain-containing protein, partial [Quisquiliibacterium sp.]|nr:NYN domain-containing protein [Quisquiliibacterium sp.]